MTEGTGPVFKPGGSGGPGEGVDMVKVAIMGAAGRMGGALIRCAGQTPDIRLVAAVEQPGNAALGRDAGLVAGIGAVGVIVSEGPGDAAADVMIDFSAHEAAPEHARAAAAAGIALVLGTTGLTAGERDAVLAAARRVPIVWAPNMSLGVNLLFAAVEKAASVLRTGYRVELEETHHAHKKDAPSGTALRLGEKVAAGRGQDFAAAMLHNPLEPAVELPPDRIVIRSRREGEVVGDHTVAFENKAERIEFTHRARSRDAFAMGALHAARWVAGRAPGLYDMQDVLGL